MGTNGSIPAEEFIKSLHLFTHLARHNMENRFVEQVSGGEITFVQMNLMNVLGKYPGRTVGDVAKFMNVSYPAATKTIDKLVRLGYLKRKEDQRDHRIARLQLTPSGQKVVDKYREHKEERINRVMERVNHGGAGVFYGHLLDFARAMIDELGVIDGACLQCGVFDPEICSSNGSGDCGYLMSLGKAKKDDLLNRP